MNKILVVSPEPSLRLFYAEELMEEGFEVVTADREPIPELIEREIPDLIVLDRDLGDEKALLKAIGKERSGLPILFGLDQVPLKSDLHQDPQTDYFIKGLDLEELKSKVKRFLRPKNVLVKDVEILYPFSATPTSQLNLDFLYK